MLFKDIAILDEEFQYREHQWVGTEGTRIAYVGDAAPADAARFGEEYDGAGNNVTTTYVGPDDQPTENNKGVAIIRREYDAARNCVAEYYLDAQGDPTENKSGVAEIHRVFDESRNLLSEERLDLMGNSR